MSNYLPSMLDPWWQARSRGRHGRSKPGRRTKGWLAFLAHPVMVPDARRRKVNAARRLRQAQRGQVLALERAGWAKADALRTVAETEAAIREAMAELALTREQAVSR